MPGAPGVRLVRPLPRQSGLDEDNVTMVQRRPTHGPHVNPYPGAVDGGSVAQTTLNGPSLRVIFGSTRRIDG
jgi:hypothetical protein